MSFSFSKCSDFLVPCQSFGGRCICTSHISYGQDLAGAKKLDIFDIQETLLLATLRENPAKFVKHLVGSNR